MKTQKETIKDFITTLMMKKFDKIVEDYSGRYDDLLEKLYDIEMESGKERFTTQGYLSGEHQVSSIVDEDALMRFYDDRGIWDYVSDIKYKWRDENYDEIVKSYISEYGEDPDIESEEYCEFEWEYVDGSVEFLNSALVGTFEEIYFMVLREILGDDDFERFRMTWYKSDIKIQSDYGHWTGDYKDYIYGYIYECIEEKGEKYFDVLEEIGEVGLIRDIKLRGLGITE